MRTAILALLASMPLAAAAQLANGGFESWSPQTSNPSRIYPSGWHSLDGAYLYRSPDAFEGSYALTVNVWYYYAKTEVAEHMPITHRPAAFTGHYKYTDAVLWIPATSAHVPDTALVSVYMTRWNSATHQRDTIGSGRLPLAGQAAYTAFSCPISYTGTALPDSVAVSIDPSMLKRYTTGPNYMSQSGSSECSFLSVDNLAFSATAAAVATAAREQQLTVFPNPATHQLTISGAPAGSKLTICNAAGQQVLGNPSINTPAPINIGALPAGPYIITVTAPGGATIVKKFTKE